MKDEKTHRILLRGTTKDGLYLLKGIQLQPIVLLGERTTPHIWHNRLSHPQFKIMKQIIVKHGLLTAQLPKQYMCDAWCTSKTHKLHFSRSNRILIKPLELIHSDLCGPSQVLSHFGFSFYVIFIDDFSIYVWLYLSKLKSDF